MPPQKCGASGIFNRTPIKQERMKKIRNILFKLNIKLEEFILINILIARIYKKAAKLTIL